MKHTRYIPKETWDDLTKNAVKEWHFEKCNGGVKPVRGKYDWTNTAHIKTSDVIKINQGLIQR
jgi:hypothetical protein